MWLFSDVNVSDHFTLPFAFPLGWDSELSSSFLLVHLLLPTLQGHKRSAKINSSQAVSFLKVCLLLVCFQCSFFLHSHFLHWGPFVFGSFVSKQFCHDFHDFVDDWSIGSFEPGQPFLMCFGEQRNSIQDLQSLLTSRSSCAKERLKVRGLCVS